MQIARIDRTHLLPPFIQKYVLGEIPEATSFAPNWQGIAEAIQHKGFTLEQRNHLAVEWAKQYHAESPRQSLIRSLSQEGAFTVTTGHQLVLASGPAYTIYKIVSAIALARQCASQFPHYRFIPVFWLASEDHDFEEISSVHTRTASYRWENESKGPVGRLSVTEVKVVLQPWINWLKGMGSTSIAEMIENAYDQKNLSEATRYLIDEIFKEYELLIFDGDQSAFKAQFSPIMHQELDNEFVFDAMEKSSHWIENGGWSKQVNPRAINLFYQTNDFRLRIVKDTNGWCTVDNSKSWSREELFEDLRTSPEKFSPNVTMRPLYQEMCLPNIAYIGGPGEVAYWLQLKPVFEAIKLSMPVVLLRDSALIISSSNYNRWLKLGASDQLFANDLNKELTALVANQRLDLQPTRSEIQAIMERLKSQLNALDPSLATATDIELKRQMEGLDAIDKKMAKVIRQKEEQRTIQLTKFYDEIYPNGQQQERFFNFLDLQSTNGIDLLKAMVEEFNPLLNHLHVIMDTGLKTTAV